MLTYKWTDINHDGRLWTDKDHDGAVDKRRARPRRTSTATR